MVSDEQKKAYNVVLALILALLHIWNTYCVFAEIADAPQSRFDTTELAYVLFGVPFALVSLLGVLHVFELLQLLQKNYLKKPALILLLLSASIVPVFLAALFLSVTGGGEAGGLFLFFVLGGMVSAGLLILKKVSPETPAKSAKYVAVLVALSLGLFLGGAYGLSVVADVPSLPMNFYTLLVFGFMLLLLPAQSLLYKYPKAVHLLWVWAAIALYIFIRNESGTEWWRPGNYTGLEDVYTTEEKPQTTVHPDSMYFQELDTSGRVKYYKQDSIIGGQRISVQYHIEYYPTGEVRLRGLSYYKDRQHYSNSIFYYPTGEKKVVAETEGYSIQRAYRYSKVTGQIMDSVNSYPSTDWIVAEE